VLIAEAIFATFKGARAQRDMRWTAITFVAAALSCMLALVIFLFTNDRSSKPFVKQFESQMTVNDQFVFLDVYPFDMQFYTQDPKPAWVVFNWPALPKGDTWRNELAEAGEHVPEKAREVLITPDQVLPRICSQPNRTYWFVAYPEAKEPVPYLAHLDRIFVTPYRVEMWKLVPDDAFTKQWCSGGKTSDSTQ